MSNEHSKKGINLNDFLAKREAVSIQDKKIPDNSKIKKAVEKKSRAIVVSGKKVTAKKEKISSKLAVVKKTKKGKKNKEEDPKTPKIEPVKLFKYIEADRVVEKDKLLLFIKFCSIPKEVRELKTQREFSEKFGIGMDTLSNWKSIAGFWDEVSIYHKNEMKRFMNDVGMGILKSAKKGNPKASELYLKYYMDWSEKIKVEDETPERIITDKEKLNIDHALKNIGLATIIKHNQVKDEDSSKN